MNVEPDSVIHWQTAPKWMERRPATYPLPLTHDGLAWWEFNVLAIGTVDGWRAHQSRKGMAELIPELERLRAVYC